MAIILPKAKTTTSGIAALRASGQPMCGCFRIELRALPRVR